jgi:hypothetical protein
VSESFPVEVRALAIAFFYAVGTGIGGAIGPVLYGHLIDADHPGKLAVGFVIAAVLMVGGGIVEALLGVNAEQKPLEEVAEPLSAEGEEAEGEEAEEKPKREPLPRYRARTGWSPYQMTSIYQADDPLQEREMQRIVDAVSRDGDAHWRQIAHAVGARNWGPGRFRRAMHAAKRSGRIREVRRGVYGPRVTASEQQQ